MGVRRTDHIDHLQNTAAPAASSTNSLLDDRLPLLKRQASYLAKVAAARLPWNAEGAAAAAAAAAAVEQTLRRK